jgi:arylsulfatase A-like enzyme
MSGHPNILFLCVDQWPGRLLGCAGNSEIETPTIDRLAASGTRFTRAYSETPVCIPARRSIMTGTSPRVHGDRVFKAAAFMPPELPTLAQTFRDNGYQAYSTGKLHVFPQRDRIGFDDALIYEEGRSNLGSTDDYEIYLAEQGLAGKQNLHGMSQNEFSWAPWHLEDRHHPTNWITLLACRTIKRRDPNRPAFWHVSYNHPHPPLVPLKHYFERYARHDTGPANHGAWANEDAPYAVKLIQATWDSLPKGKLADARRAFYALCTHIDHQMRVIIGTLREEDLLDNTVIVFTSDHGEMLGEHGLYAKRVMYEMSANIPMIISGPPKDMRVLQNSADDRLIGLQDVMPTLLDLAGLDIPETCTGISMIGESQRESLYCEAMEGLTATRMITDKQYKLIWYPAGNRLQLFDLMNDPQEANDLSGDASHSDILDDLTNNLIDELYGIDKKWQGGGRLIGFEAPESIPVQNRNLSGQRGLHYPPVPVTDPTAAHGVTDRWEAKKN